MKRTPLIALTILCMALVSCASSDGTDPIDRNASMGQPGRPQATEPEEMHGHTHNATGVSTAETSVKGNSATVIAGNAMESPTDGATTTTVTTVTPVTTTVPTESVTRVDATLVPAPSTSTTTVSGTSGVSSSQTTDTTATMAGTGTVTSTTTTTEMTSSTTTDDDDDDDTTSTRRRMRKD